MKMSPEEIKAVLAGGGNLIPNSFPGDAPDPNMRNLMLSMMAAGNGRPAPRPENIASMVVAAPRPIGI